MKNPTKEQVQKVIDVFTEVLPMAQKLESAVSMRETAVDHSCGTPMCHAGWYAVKNERAKYYLDGAYIMVKDLGFEFKHELEIWACENPEIWGNEFGKLMFFRMKAFKGKYDGSCDFEKASLELIIEHWKGVKGRLDK